MENGLNKSDFNFPLEIFSTVAEYASEGLFVTENNGYVLYANEAVCSIFGRKREEFLGKVLFDVIEISTKKEDVSQKIESISLQSLSDKIIDSQNLIVPQSNGTSISIEIAFRMVELERKSFFILFVNYLTKERDLLRKLNKANAYFNNIVEKNKSGILVLNLDGRVMFANPAAESLLQRPLDSIINSDFGLPSQISDRQQMEILHPNGSLSYVEASVSKTSWEGRRAYLLMLHDITFLKEAERQVRQLVSHDILTGLANRLQFGEELERFVREGKRSSDLNVAVLFMDLDKFKDVNDVFGHAAGDTLLIETGKRLQACLRETDVLARFGGDEFVAIVRVDETKTNIQTIVNRMLESFKTPFVIDNNNIKIGISIGISVFPEDANNAEDLIRLADTAMYSAKADRYGPRYFYYSKEMGELAYAHYLLNEEIANATRSKEFFLYYQPQVDLRDGKLCGFEALIRWHKSDGSVVLPGSFIPILEETGKIIEVGQWVFEQAVNQLKAWFNNFEAIVPISINVSGVQINHSNILSHIQSLLNENQELAGYLAIELTESVLINNLKHTKIVLEQLNTLGIECHLDDFGTGVSSLSMLRDVCLDFIKIDQSFVREIADRGSDSRLIEAIVNVGNSLDIRLIAEGVETELQRDVLIGLGCDRAQGYLFGKALPAKEVENSGWLARDWRFF